MHLMLNSQSGLGFCSLDRIGLSLARPYLICVKNGSEHFHAARTSPERGIAFNGAPSSDDQVDGGPRWLGRLSTCSSLIVG